MQRWFQLEGPEVTSTISLYAPRWKSLTWCILEPHIFLGLCHIDCHYPLGGSEVSPSLPFPTHYLVTDSRNPEHENLHYCISINSMIQVMWGCSKYAPLSACQFSVSINFPKFYAKLITKDMKIGLQTNSKGNLLANAWLFPFWTCRHLSSRSPLKPCVMFLAPQVPRPAPHGQPSSRKYSSPSTLPMR